jgi:hypothetical protein
LSLRENDEPEIYLYLSFGKLELRLPNFEHFLLEMNMEMMLFLRDLSEWKESETVYCDLCCWRDLVSWNGF